MCEEKRSKFQRVHPRVAYIRNSGPATKWRAMQHVGILCGQVHHFRKIKVICNSTEYIENVRYLHDGSPLFTNTLASWHQPWQQLFKLQDCICTDRTYSSLWNGKSHVWRRKLTNFENNSQIIENDYPSPCGICIVAISHIIHSAGRWHANQLKSTQAIFTITGLVLDQKRRPPWHTLMAHYLNPLVDRKPYVRTSLNYSTKCTELVDTNPHPSDRVRTIKYGTSGMTWNNQMHFAALHSIIW